MNELLLTVEQAAERLQVTPYTVREQLKKGWLRGIKRGRLWRVPESALLESTNRKATSHETKVANPLTVALQQSQALKRKLQEGTSGPLDAARDVEVNRADQRAETKGNNL